MRRYETVSLIEVYFGLTSRHPWPYSYTKRFNIGLMFQMRTWLQCIPSVCLWTSAVWAYTTGLCSTFYSYTKRFNIGLMFQMRTWLQCIPSVCLWTSAATAAVWAWRWSPVRAACTLTTTATTAPSGRPTTTTPTGTAGVTRKRCTDWH